MKKRCDNDIKEHESRTGGDAAEALLKCEDIQGVLFAYMSRELGDTQSAVVREHIRKCDGCRAEAAEIEATLALLHQDGEGKGVPHARLSDERRKRILRAVFHPVIDWVDVHHRAVSIVLAIIVLVVALFVMHDVELFRPAPLEERIPIWRMFKSGALPELVERERNRTAEEAPLQPKVESKVPEAVGNE